MSIDDQHLDDGGRGGRASERASQHPDLYKAEQRLVSRVDVM
jgi:hypothetical protein